MSTRVWEAIKKNRLMVIVLVAALLNMANTVTVVLLAKEDRQSNCVTTYESLVDYTNRLGHRLGADQATIDEFAEGLAPILEKCT